MMTTQFNETEMSAIFPNFQIGGTDSETNPKQLEQSVQPEKTNEEQIQNYLEKIQYPGTL